MRLIVSARLLCLFYMAHVVALYSGVGTGLRFVLILMGFGALLLNQQMLDAIACVAKTMPSFRWVCGGTVALLTLALVQLETSFVYFRTSAYVSGVAFVCVLVYLYTGHAEELFDEDDY